ncbi:DHS-like NAD/FAD-binding domain-containing protein [Cantharellus anzutake]|uniref:DHS-like NAD/FAD-binding domain-containing protein n=1 Tax=Cantharellus anzutake TaxID=1750568 RepID=UPI001904EEC5|nr:DHS-like NAD/FAD-binding domain-containing protein [Cantharellus anzutake]KAF8323511.1 DHS-like NAD/FAD-binding domain-containing protein [Cantharellus anzutake]
MAVKLLRRTMHRIRQHREKLSQYNTVDDAVRLIASARKIMVVTGAGISVSCGIPDFRSPTGLYARLKGFELDDPQQMFDIDYFKMYPEVFYSFAYQIYPSNFVPSPCHRFVKLLEDRGALLRNYTQNIDNIEGIVGIKRLFQCHGSFATASCIVCRHTVPGSTIEDHIFAKTIPFCEVCTKRTAALKSSKGPNKGKRKGKWDDDEEGENSECHLMKPDITFFGEKLASKFDDLLREDMGSREFDLLLIIGTSLKVAPVADIVYRIPHSIPQILINKTPVVHANPDVVLLGDADTIVQHLCWCLKWQIPPPPHADNSVPNNEVFNKGSVASLFDENDGMNRVPTRLGNSHFWLFQGAEPGPILNRVGTGVAKEGSAANASTVDGDTTPASLAQPARPRSVSASSSLSSLSSLESLPPPKSLPQRTAVRFDIVTHKSRREHARGQKRLRRN